MKSNTELIPLVINPIQNEETTQTDISEQSIPFEIEFGGYPLHYHDNSLTPCTKYIRTRKTPMPLKINTSSNSPNPQLAITQQPIIPTTDINAEHLMTNTSQPPPYTQNRNKIKTKDTPVEETPFIIQLIWVIGLFRRFSYKLTS